MEYLWMEAVGNAGVEKSSQRHVDDVDICPRRALNPICRIAVCTTDEKTHNIKFKEFSTKSCSDITAQQIFAGFLFFYKNKLEQDSCLLMSLTYQMLS